MAFRTPKVLVITGTPNKSSTANVTIKVVDYYLPVFSRPVYRARIPEDSAKDSDVVVVKAVGSTGQRFGYMLESGDAMSQFYMDFLTGKKLLCS